MTSSIETSDTWPFDGALASQSFTRGWKEGWLEGWLEGWREACSEDILIVLEARNLDVTDAERERIAGCTNLEQLKTWLRRAVTAEKTSDTFDGSRPD